jgi:hypothetical protein
MFATIALTGARPARSFRSVFNLTGKYYSWQPLNVEAGD